MSGGTESASGRASSSSVTLLSMAGTAKSWVNASSMRPPRTVQQGAPTIEPRLLARTEGGFTETLPPLHPVFRPGDRWGARGC